MEAEKKTGIWAITPGGGSLGLELAGKLGNADFYIPAWLESSLGIKSNETGTLSCCKGKIFIFQSLADKLSEKFAEYTGHVFIFSTGIAVRLIAPLLQSKLKDPAVVVIDDRACHAISLVSGHIGNANELAEKIAILTGADPVITTATDINHLPAIDMIAKKQNLIIENPGMIKKINMAFLKKQKINLIDPYGLVSPYLSDNFLYHDMENTNKIKGLKNNQMKEKTQSSISPSVLCSDEIVPFSRETLILRPRLLIVGIGCNRNTCSDEIKKFIKKVFKDLRLCLKSIELIASSDIKQDEKGLLELADEMSLKLKFYNKEALNSVKNIKNPSVIVEKHIGVKSVCEAAAILASKNGKLIVPKMKKGNVTLAVARKSQNYL